MTIGELLKENRKKLNLTQKEMAGTIVSTSFYYRVEQDNTRISAIDLLKILKVHHINISDFIDQLTIKLNNQTDEDEIIDTLFIAFFNNDIDTVMQLKKYIYLRASQTTKLYIKLIEALLKQYRTILNKQDEDLIRKELFNGLNWSIPTLKLFTNSMFIYTSDELSFLLTSILNKYQTTKNETVQKFIASICINFLDLCYKRKNFTFWKKGISFLFSLPSTPELLMYKLLGKYYQAILEKDKTTIDHIKTTLMLSGFSNYIELLPNI